MEKTLENIGKQRTQDSKYENIEDDLIQNAINFFKSKLNLESHPVVSKLTKKISNIKSEVFEYFSKKIPF